MSDWSEMLQRDLQDHEHPPQDDQLRMRWAMASVDRRILLTALMDQDEELARVRCHCGQPVYVHIEPKGFTRGLCRDCDAVRCDAYPGECR